jgi:hypothetical protein
MESKRVRGCELTGARLDRQLPLSKRQFSARSGHRARKHAPLASIAFNVGAHGKRAQGRLYHKLADVSPFDDQSIA